MGQLADGVILVLSAQRTRRVTARNVKEGLERAEARILGTVLSDRDFPIPERIYRRVLRGSAPRGNLSQKWEETKNLPPFFNPNKKTCSSSISPPLGPGAPSGAKIKKK